jgi:hypothetical protein
MNEGARNYWDFFLRYFCCLLFERIYIININVYLQ